MTIKIYGQSVKTFRRSLKRLLVSLIVLFIGICFIPKTYSIEVPDFVVVKLPESETIKPTTKEMVMKIVDFYGQDKLIVNVVIQCESQWSSTKPGDSNQSFGLWQWHLKSHPEISKSCALNPVCSTYMAMEHISPQGKYFKEGGWKLWTCYNMKF